MAVNPAANKAQDGSMRLNLGEFSSSRKLRNRWQNTDFSHVQMSEPLSYRGIFAFSLYCNDLQFAAQKRFVPLAQKRTEFQRLSHLLSHSTISNYFSHPSVL